MKNWILATAALALLGNASVIGCAQAQTLSPNSARNTPSSMTRDPAQPNSATLPEAPIGHRQPTRGDVPSETGRNNPANIDAQDRDLDRMIKGICKGC